ncbi:MAG: hypothetical protein JJU36_04685, partial [Phycisphaeraceae bacterium]|nr:hypothetical protein [Phycisphaeraceae bacterium]
VCATAWTPAAAGMIVAGVSPGAVLVFLLAGPVTNMASLGVVYRHLGARATAAFVAGIAISALSCGLLVDALISPDLIVGQIGDVREAELIPLWLKVGCAVFLVAVAIRPLRRFLSRWMLKLSGRASNVAA